MIPLINTRRRGRIYSINLNTTTSEAFQALLKLDDTFVGTQNYFGLAYFWAYDYRHYLRDESIANRIKIHNAMLKAGLDVSATSDKHLEILYKYVRCMYGKRDVNFTKEYMLQQFIDTYKAFEEA